MAEGELFGRRTDKPADEIPELYLESNEDVKISKLAKYEQDYQELQNLIQKLNILKNGFKDNLTKTGANESVIQRNHRDAINEIKNLRDKFDKLMMETDSQVENVKQEDLNKIEKVASTCDIVIEQINELTTNLEILKEKGDTEGLFISMKSAENQLNSLEGNLGRIDKDNVVREYKFQPDARLKTLFNDLKRLGQLLFEKSGNLGILEQIKPIGPSEQKKKRPKHIKDITVTSSSDEKFDVKSCLLLSNTLILITDSNNQQLRLIDMDKNQSIAELKLSECPFDITKVQDNEVAVTIPNSYKIQFVSVTELSLSKGREISVNEGCWGITYNDKDQTFIVVIDCDIQILNMDGSVIKCLDKDSKGNSLFINPFYVALSPSKTEIYVTDSGNVSVTLMTMNGDVKAVYKDESLKNPSGICVHTSGLVYVVGVDSNSVNQLDPDSGEFELLLDQKDGLNVPLSISYNEMEDHMYIGMCDNNVLKVFQMK